MLFKLRFKDNKAQRAVEELIEFPTLGEAEEAGRAWCEKEMHRFIGVRDAVLLRSKPYKAVIDEVEEEKRGPGRPKKG